MKSKREKFDGILCAAAAPLVPKKLKQQLNIGAKLVCPVGDQENQKLMTVKRISKEGFEEELVDAKSCWPPGFSPLMHER